MRRSSRSGHPRRTLPACRVGARSRRPAARPSTSSTASGCHEGSLPRLPNREALRAMAPEAIDTALSSFSMRRQGAALSSAERRAVAAFLAGRPAGSYRAPLEMIGKEAYCAARRAPRDPLAGAAWNGWGVDARNSRSQTAAAAGLTAADVPKLKLKWAFGIPGVSASGSQVTVVGSRAFVGSRNGVVYALDTKTGCLAWAFEADAGVRSTPVVGRGADGSSTLYFGDAHAQVYALDATTGQRRWKVKVEDHLDAMITGAVAFHNGRLYVPVSSLEEGHGGHPDLRMLHLPRQRRGPRCRERQADLEDATRFRRRRSEQQRVRAARSCGGRRAAAVWSQPAVDAERNRIYITTGDSYSNPPAPRERRDHGAGHGHRTRALGPADAGGRRVECRLSRDRAGTRELSGEGAGPTSTSRARHRSPCCPTASASSSPVRSPERLFGLNPDTGEQLWKTQAGAGRHPGRHRMGLRRRWRRRPTCRSRARSRRSPVRPAGWSRSTSPMANRAGRFRRRPTPATRGRGATPVSRRRCRPFLASCSRAVSMDICVRTTARPASVLWDINTVNEYDTVNRVPARGGSMNGPGATIVGGMVFVNSGYGSLGFMPGQCGPCVFDRWQVGQRQVSRQRSRCWVSSDVRAWPRRSSARGPARRVHADRSGRRRSHSTGRCGGAGPDVRRAVRRQRTLCCRSRRDRGPRTARCAHPHDRVDWRAAVARCRHRFSGRRTPRDRLRRDARDRGTGDASVLPGAGIDRRGSRRTTVAFSLDLRDGQPITTSPNLARQQPDELVARAVDAGADAVIVLDLARVGTGRGLDLQLIARLKAASPSVRLFAGGGVRGIEDSSICEAPDAMAPWSHRPCSTDSSSLNLALHL